MMNKKENSGLSWKMWVSISASFLYAAIAVFFLWQNQKYSEHLKLSEIGDYLAGAFSPLAFLWLVIGYLMQSKELSMNREELKISREALERQADELSKSSSYQKELAKLTKIEIDSLKKSKLPLIEINKIIYNEKEFIELDNGFFSETGMDDFYIKIFITNFGKKIINASFSTNTKTGQHDSSHMNVEHNSNCVFNIPLLSPLEGKVKINFNFLTEDLDKYIFKYNFLIEQLSEDHFVVHNLEPSYTGGL